MKTSAIQEIQAEVSGPSLIMITGGIGSGKSVVSRILRLNGYPVYDCDSEAKRIMETDSEVIEALIEILGEEAYSMESAGEAARADSFGNEFLKGKRINRPYIAARIFSDAGLRGMVNGVVHQAVRDDVIRFACEHSGTVFCETAIPVTSKMEGMCSAIWLVTAPEPERIERVKLRNGFSEEEIVRRMESQREEFGRLDEGKTVMIDNGADDLLLPGIFGLLSKETSLEIINDNIIKI